MELFGNFSGVWFYSGGTLSYLCHTCYCYISVKFPGKDLIGQYISDFYRRSENSKRSEIQKV